MRVLESNPEEDKDLIVFFNSVYHQTSSRRTQPKQQPVQKAKLEKLERLGVS